MAAKIRASWWMLLVPWNSVKLPDENDFIAAIYYITDPACCFLRALTSGAAPAGIVDSAATYCLGF